MFERSRTRFGVLGAVWAAHVPRATLWIQRTSSILQNTHRTKTTSRWSAWRWWLCGWLLRLACAPRQATLTLAETRTPVALIKRFDRSGADRLHYISARTFLGNTGAEDAYYTDLADSMRAYCGSAEGVREELRELYRRIMFTILVSNEDDHLKNHGFLYDGNGSWRLSPAFDINPTPDRRAYLKTGISELSGYNASIEAAIEAAPLFELREDDVLAEAQHMAAIIAQRWRPLCQEMGMNRDECARYVPAFQNPELLSMLALKQADDSGLGTV